MPAATVPVICHHGRPCPLSPDAHLRPTAASASGPPPPGWLAVDTRTSSTQSLAPSVPDSDPRRRLLIVYIHGFYGNHQLRYFPAHVHPLMRTLLADSHIIHSKVYPRYKTYRAIKIARDDFSAWLQPHESPTTDVILIGHSMGGLLAAEVLLMPNHSPYRQHPFKHRILGTISLDSPFLGLHPGLVVSGISSLFQPAHKPPQDCPGEPHPAASPPSSISPPHSIDSQLGAAPPSISTPPAPGPTDPYFDPPFWNDKPFREQPFIKRMIHFASKHRSEGVFNAVRNHVVSHLEFGGCLADYRGLISRYNKIRALEDVDQLKAASDGLPPAARARVRFVNYYTLSTGRPKTPKASPSASAGESSTGGLTGYSQGDVGASTQSACGGCHHQDKTSMLHVEYEMQHHQDSNISTPRISVEAPRDEGEQQEPAGAMGSIGDGRMNDETSNEMGASGRMSVLSMQDMEPVPITHDEQTPQQKKTQRDGAKAIRERDKLLEKERKEAQKANRLAKEAQSAQRRGEEARRQKKLRKFCNLPSKVDGVRDRTWVQVLMDGVDEVGAHCGLFIPGPHYEKLVGDVGCRIASWVHEDMSKRAILDLRCAPPYRPTSLVAIYQPRPRDRSTHPPAVPLHAKLDPRVPVFRRSPSALLRQVPLAS